jgi:hypothetical protein
MITNEAIMIKVAEIKTDVINVRKEILDVKASTEENRRVLKGYNGDRGLQAQFLVYCDRQETMKDKIDNIYKGIWAIALLVLGLILTSLYGLITNPTTTEVVRVITATPGP